MTQKLFTRPFRLGRKQKRAILDANGLEVCIFPKGHESEAQITCDLYNSGYESIIDLFDYETMYSKADIIRVLSLK